MPAEIPDAAIAVTTSADLIFTKPPETKYRLIHRSHCDSALHVAGSVHGVLTR